MNSPRRPRRPRWDDHAACKGLTDAFFPERGDSVGADAARRVCLHSCPVRQQCLDAALQEEGSAGKSTRYGVRGGLTPNERHRLAGTLGLLTNPGRQAAA